MSEQRMTYDVWSSDDQRHVREDETLLWRQQQGNSGFSSDIVLLLPLFQSAQIDEGNSCSPCVHLVRLHDARLGLCNILTEHHCACCYCPMCEQHYSEQEVSFPDRHGVWHEEYTARLCTTCALLPKETQYALYAFRRAINCQQNEKEEAQHAHQQKDQA